MTKLFDIFYRKILLEAGPPGGAPDQQQDQGGGEGGGAMKGENEVGVDLSNPEMEDGSDLEPEEEEPVSLEELELAKLAVRALYFNIDSKDVHKFHINYKGHNIPFEKLSDFFEHSKKSLVVLAFIEHIMDSYEGFASKWTEEPEIKGKTIVDKIKAINAVAEPEEKLDKGKRVYWARIILNCFLFGNPDYNLVISDVTPDNIHEIFDMLKQHFGHDTRGLRQGINLGAPGVD